MKKYVVIAMLLTIGGLGFRLFLALGLPNDAPDDGRLYARIAINILEHRSYSIESEEPFSPTYIRVPGYPLFLAAVYSLFGHNNNRAVRMVQAVLDTCTCWLIALLAVAWAPASWSREKRRRLALIALALAVLCPFPAIYVATILTETCTIFLATVCALSASLAMNAVSSAKSAGLWVLAGLSGGVATMFRPDGGLFVAAVGFTLAIIATYKLIRRRARSAALGGALGDQPRRVIGRSLVYGAMLAAGFALALGPWTIRNAREFGVLQPIAPAQANMPGEFVPRGYIRWLKTWVDDVKYTETLEWSLDDRPIHVEQMPRYAFESQDEREQVARLLDRYNNPDSKPPDTPEIQVTTPQVADKSDADAGENDEADSQSESDSDGPDQQEEQKIAVEMTPEIDAGFAEIARERVARHPIRYYVVTPLRRASSLWFDTHSQYYPFEGELFPLNALDTDNHQQYWLPGFMALTLMYTLLAIAGGLLMWIRRSTRQWLLLLLLLIIPRMAFLASMENPEPRYAVEFFAFIIPAGGLAVAHALDCLRFLGARARH